MLGLPKTTEMSKQLPKKAIYTKFQMNTAAKEKIDADISRITIVNEIAPNKVNIPSGEDVKSFFLPLYPVCSRIASAYLTATNFLHPLSPVSLDNFVWGI